MTTNTDARPITTAKVAAGLRKLGLTRAVTRTTVDVHGYGRRTTGDYTVRAAWDGDGVEVQLVARMSTTANERRRADVRAFFEDQGRTVTDAFGGMVIR
jgi:hypothetical protein